jgi:hypothetical protein
VVGEPKAKAEIVMVLPPGADQLTKQLMLSWCLKSLRTPW